MWNRHSTRPIRVRPEVYLAVFRKIYDILEQDPDMPLAGAADQILEQLERK